MEWNDPFYRLEFENDSPFNEKVEPVSGIEMKFSVRDWQLDLCLNAERGGLHLVLETGGVRAFEQSRSKLGVDLKRSPNNPFGQVRMNEHGLPSVSSVSSAVASSSQVLGLR